MHRTPIIRLLEQYQTLHADENFYRIATLGFVRNNPRCFERSLEIGHVTGSAWIINPERTHTLLIHHHKLDKWFQPGGHCDGDPDVLKVAVKEAFEETGLTVVPCSTEIFDIDNHIIPARKEVPEHIHFDIRFLCTAIMTGSGLSTNREIKAISWVKLSEVSQYSKDPSLQRMVLKTENA